MKWEYEKACIDAGMEEERIKELRRLFDREKKRLKYEKDRMVENNTEYRLFSKMEEQDYYYDISINDASQDIEEIAIRQLETERLGNCLQVLSVEEKQLIKRYYCDGISLLQISIESGKTYSTVYNQHCRIIEKLRKEMGVKSNEQY